jgi:hypothetical protein
VTDRSSEFGERRFVRFRRRLGHRIFQETLKQDLPHGDA